MKSALVSMAISLASAGSRSSTCRVKVPTPGPYSTNNLTSSQRTGPSILSISTLLDGMTEPTITGFFRKPRRNCHCGLFARCATRRTKRRGPLSVRADETVIESPEGSSKGNALAKALGVGKFPRAFFTHGPALLKRDDAFAAIAPGDRRHGDVDPQFPAPVHGHAGRGGGQYGAAVGDAGDRPGDRHRRFLGGGRLHLVGGAVGGLGALLGAQERPPRPQTAHPPRAWRLYRLDDPVRIRACRRP